MIKRKKDRLLPDIQMAADCTIQFELNIRLVGKQLETLLMWKADCAFLTQVSTAYTVLDCFCPLFRELGGISLLPQLNTL